MIKRSIILGALFFLMSGNVLAAYYHLLGYEQCVGIDKISHVPGQPWKVMDSAWTVSKEDANSSLTQFSADTVIQRRVEPYHTGYKLAGVTCNYQSDTLVLTRTYEEKMPPFPQANYIIADTNASIKAGGWFFWNYTTSCLTTLAFLDKCRWGFYNG